MLSRIKHHGKKYAPHISIGALVIGAIIFLFILSIVSDLPSPTLLENRQVAESTKIYDRTGSTLLYELYGEEKRTIIPFADISEQAKQATIAIEDADFYNHGAFDLRGIFRAVIANLRAGGISQGGSTITQQLAKKAFLTDDRTFTRKIKELILAFRLEKAFTKDEILELYLNQIPYGGNAYGIEAASKTYFNKSARDLTLTETAVLAALPQSPSYYSPWGTHTKELFARKDLVLTRMFELGYISEQEAEIAKADTPVFIERAARITAPHFTLAVVDYLNAKYGEEFVRTAGMKVVTTLNADLQKTAEEVVKTGAERNTELYGGTNAALVAEDATTGQILALVGSHDYFDLEHDGNFNVAMQGLRQPGSALKPFVYLAAFQKGYRPETVLFDLKTEFDATEIPENSYQPNNYDETFRGPITLRESLAQSINVPAVKTLYLAGVDNFLKLIKSFGITTLNERGRYGLSLTLGGGEVKLVDLVHAYSVLAQEGVKHTQSMILEIKNNKGEVLEQYQDKIEQVAEAEPIRLVNEILSDEEARSPLFHSSMYLTVFPGYDVAIKTGTTNDYRDAWAVGYSPNLVVGVWAGNNDNQAMKQRGGSILAAVPMLHPFMSEALKITPAQSFNRPEVTPATKPMIRGDYLVTYEFGGQKYPQVHDILFYVNKSDPLGARPLYPEADSQFKNWETPTLEWARVNVPGFVEGVTYNQLLPMEAVPSQLLNQGETTQSAGVVILSPTAGSFIKNGAIFMNATITASPANPILKVEVLLNGNVIDSTSAYFTAPFGYQKILYVQNPGQQNLFKVVATDSAGAVYASEAILYN